MYSLAAVATMDASAHQANVKNQLAKVKRKDRPANFTYLRLSRACDNIYKRLPAKPISEKVTIMFSTLRYNVMETWSAGCKDKTRKTEVPREAQQQRGRRAEQP